MMHVIQLETRLISIVLSEIESKQQRMWRKVIYILYICCDYICMRTYYNPKLFR